MLRSYPVLLSPRMYVRLFSNYLRHFLKHWTLRRPSTQFWSVAVNFEGRNMCLTQTPNHTTHYPVALTRHINLSPDWALHHMLRVTSATSEKWYTLLTPTSQAKEPYTSVASHIEPTAISSQLQNSHSRSRRVLLDGHTEHRPYNTLNTGSLLGVRICRLKHRVLSVVHAGSRPVPNNITTVCYMLY